MHLLFPRGNRDTTTASTATVGTEESSSARTNNATLKAYESPATRYRRERGLWFQSIRHPPLSQSNSFNNKTKFPADQGPSENSAILSGEVPATQAESTHQADVAEPRLSTVYEFKAERSTKSDPTAQGSGIESQGLEQMHTDYEFPGRATQSDSSQGAQNDESPTLNTDYEFPAGAQSESARGASSEGKNVQIEFDQESGKVTSSQSGSSLPKLEIDFNQKQKGASSASGPAKFEIDFRHKSVPDAKEGSTADTQEGHESDTIKEVELETGSPTGRETSSEDEGSDEDEMKAELEGESRRLPEPAPRIVSQPMGKEKQKKNLVFGQISIMATNVSNEALLVPLKSPALADLLDNGHKYRAIALRCGCELIFTRRIIVKRLVKWSRFSVLLIRGPSDAAIKRFRQCLEAANRAFHQAVPFDAERNRPRLLANENLPDNLDLGVCADRTGAAVSNWERRLPLDMPQRRLGQPLVGKQQNRVLPNNAAIGQVLAYVYPKWGFQTSQPVPHSQLFEAAVDEALEGEKRQAAEFKM